MKWKIEGMCCKCKRPNHVTVYEGLIDEDFAEINPCQCKEEEKEG